MGSYASSYNASSTNYTNAPVAQEDVTNPINLINSSGIRLNSNDSPVNLSGNSQLSVLDGGAIASAFDFGNKAVQIVADLTRASNQTLQSANMEATKIASQAQSGLEANKNQEALADWTQNKTLVFGGVLVAIAFFYFRK